jgi:hypothetical protein
MARPMLVPCVLPVHTRQLFVLFPKEKFMRHATALIAFAAASVCAAGLALAQVDAPPKSSTTSATPETQHQHTTQTAMADTSSMMGSHDMPATVLNVDHKTGMVDVESENMKLKVHFPSNTIADLKKGDKINLHLGYSKQ